jgi:hypothetical protein
MYRAQYNGFLQTVERTFTTKKRAVQWCAQVGRKDATITHVRTCSGCGRTLTTETTETVPAGRRYTQRHGWHNATAKSCSYCGTWVRWDTDLPHTVDQLAEYATDHGSHFFDTSTLRFFGSRILDGVTVHDGRCYFVTSERDNYGDQPRRYSARYMTAGAHFFEVGKFQEYTTATAARQAIKNATK